MTRFQANLLLLLTGAIWGIGFVAQSTAMDAIGPLWFIGLRFCISALVALPLALREKGQIQRTLTRRDGQGFLLVGLALLVATTTQQIGLMTTTVTNSGFLTGLYVVLVPVMSVLVLRRMPHWIVWPGTLLAFAGIFLLSGGSLSGLSRGDVFTIVSAVFWAVQVLLIGQFVGESGRPMALSLVQFLVCAVGGCLLGALFEPVSFAAILDALPEILFAGFFSSGLAFIFQVVGQRYTTAPQAAIFLASETLFAALFGALLLGETISVTGYIGCGLIFAAILAVELVPELGRRRAA